MKPGVCFGLMNDLSQVTTMLEMFLREPAFLLRSWRLRLWAPRRRLQVQPQTAL